MDWEELKLVYGDAFPDEGFWNWMQTNYQPNDLTGIGRKRMAETGMLQGLVDKFGNAMTPQANEFWSGRANDYLSEAQADSLANQYQFYSQNVAPFQGVEPMTEPVTRENWVEATENNFLVGLQNALNQTVAGAADYYEKNKDMEEFKKALKDTGIKNKEQYTDVVRQQAQAWIDEATGIVNEKGIAAPELRQMAMWDEVDLGALANQVNSFPQNLQLFGDIDYITTGYYTNADGEQVPIRQGVQSIGGVYFDENGAKYDPTMQAWWDKNVTAQRAMEEQRTQGLWDAGNFSNEQAQRMAQSWEDYFAFNKEWASPKNTFPKIIDPAKGEKGGVNDIVVANSPEEARSLGYLNWVPASIWNSTDIQRQISTGLEKNLSTLATRFTGGLTDKEIEQSKPGLYPRGLVDVIANLTDAEKDQALRAIQKKALEMAGGSVSSQGYATRTERTPVGLNAQPLIISTEQHLQDLREGKRSGRQKDKPQKPPGATFEQDPEWLALVSKAQREVRL